MSETNCEFIFILIIKMLLNNKSLARSSFILSVVNVQLWMQHDHSKLDPRRAWALSRAHHPCEGLIRAQVVLHKHLVLPGIRHFSVFDVSVSQTFPDWTHLSSSSMSLRLWARQHQEEVLHLFQHHCCPSLGLLLSGPWETFAGTGMADATNLLTLWFVKGNGVQ